MADNDKTEHISKSIMERFSVRNLSETKLTSVSRHLRECPDCQAEFVSTLRRQREVANLSFTLAPEFWLRNEHLDYEQLVEFAEGKLDATDRELIDAHLKVCPPCQEDVRGFLVFREQIAREMNISYAPVEKGSLHERLSWLSWWRGLTWKPVYSATVVVLGIVLVFGGAFLLTRRTDDQRAQQPTPQVSPASTPAVAINLQSPTASPNESPTQKPITAEAVVLNDRGRTITVDKSGDVAGLDDVPAPTRNEIAQVLLSGRIDHPRVLKELSGEDSNLRGSNSAQSFKLISPARTVIASDRPTFEWENVSGASAYTVYVNDARGHVVARSEALAPDRREWLINKPLNRGEIYGWTVAAVVDGREITSPGPSTPERKFQVLSTANLHQLNSLRKGRSNLALGLFYAKVGMIPEAGLHLQNLLRENPNSSQAKKLLIEIRALKSP